jgi:RNA polymerase sigma factor (sigma-70 family)
MTVAKIEKPSERAAGCWTQKKHSAFYKKTVQKLKPKLHTLRQQFSLTDQECEDCVSKAFEGFVKNCHDTGRDPESYPSRYIWVSVENAANDLLRKQKEERDIQSHLKIVNPATVEDTDDEGVDQISEEAATIVFEGLCGGFEADRAWVVDVVQLAVSNLRPALRRVINHLLAQGLNYNASNAPIDLGMSSETFRANKSKAYKQLRAEIPEVMRQKRITPLRANVPDIFDIVTPFPSEIEEN